jgi:hypothetical protein
LRELKSELASAGGDLAGKACIYTIGSYGREEASEFSDLDVFIVAESGGSETKSLSKLDLTCALADLIRASRKHGFPDFSNDGEYLNNYSVQQLTETLGTRGDDHSNAFTARLLLLLESRALIGDEVHERAIAQVVRAYWRDYSDREDKFIPAFLTNDILRLWRTFCVNYEAGPSASEELRKIKRKLKNYKLKFSRLLTCYSAIAYMMLIYGNNKTVRPDEARRMALMTPVDRLQFLSEGADKPDVSHKVTELLEMYDIFLANTNKSEAELIEVFRDRSLVQRYVEESYNFGDKMSELLITVGGENNSLLRVVMV